MSHPLYSIAEIREFRGKVRIISVMIGLVTNEPQISVAYNNTSLYPAHKNVCHKSSAALSSIVFTPGLG